MGEGQTVPDGGACALHLASKGHGKKEGATLEWDTSSTVELDAFSQQLPPLLATFPPAAASSPSWLGPAVTFTPFSEEN